jgi:hypothetical protein
VVLGSKSNQTGLKIILSVPSPDREHQYFYLFFKQLTFSQRALNMVSTIPISRMWGDNNLTAPKISNKT